jgi:hypothetical protein
MRIHTRWNGSNYTGRPGSPGPGAVDSARSTNSHHASFPNNQRPRPRSTTPTGSVQSPHHGPPNPLQIDSVDPVHGLHHTSISRILWLGSFREKLIGGPLLSKCVCMFAVAHCYGVKVVPANRFYIRGNQPGSAGSLPSFTNQRALRPAEVQGAGC